MLKIIEFSFTADDIAEILVDELKERCGIPEGKFYVANASPINVTFTAPEDAA